MKKKHQFIKIFDLSVSKILFEFVNKDLLPKSGVSKHRFWKGFNQVVHKLSPINKKLIDIMSLKYADLNHKLYV